MEQGGFSQRTLLPHRSSKEFGLMKEYSFNGLAGCVSQSRSRITGKPMASSPKATGALVGVYHGEQSGMEGDPDSPWITVCEEHHNLVGHRSLRLAKSHAVDPTMWCEDCQVGGTPSTPCPTALQSLRDLDSAT